VLGANIANIIMLVARNFLLLVGVAILIAVPLAWYAGNKWLQDFAYRININGWIFMMTSLIAMVIALVSVSSQAIKAAIANPVKSLRSE